MAEGRSSAVLSSNHREFMTYNGVRGSFGNVAFFLTTVSIREAVEQLHLMPQADLSFSERIQRELNMTRVKREILPYLRSGGERFFNSLAIVPIPDKDNAEAFWFEEVATGPDGPIDKWATLHIRRDVNRIVVDGQHRKKALDLYWRAIEDGERAESLDIPVVFLFFKDIGRQGGLDSDRGAVLSCTRKLFRDLNLTARKLDHYTALLVDDAFLPGVMARRLLETESDLEPSVKWSAGSNLADDDPYLTTLAVITDAIECYVGDRETLGKEYCETLEREQAIQKHFEHHRNYELSTRQFITATFRNLMCFEDWRSLLRDGSIELPRQPTAALHGRPPARVIRARDTLRSARKACVLYTAPGQRALFRAMEMTLAVRQTQDRSAFDSILERIDALYAQGFFARVLRADGGEEVNPVWRDVLLGPGNAVLNGRKHCTAGANLISYALGGRSSRADVEAELRKNLGVKYALPALAKAV